MGDGRKRSHIRHASDVVQSANVLLFTATDDVPNVPQAAAMADESHVPAAPDGQKPSALAKPNDAA